MRSATGKLMRYNPILLLSCAMLLNGCLQPGPGAVVTPSGYQSASRPELQQPERCDVANIERRIAAPQHPVVPLDPESIALLNWNIYKGERGNWAADFGRLSKLQNIITLQEAHSGSDLLDILRLRKLSWRLNSAFSLDRLSLSVSLPR